MKSFDKRSFLLLLKFNPNWLIGKQIIYGKITAGILDVSVSGDCLHIETDYPTTEWINADSLGDSIVIDTDDNPLGTAEGLFTVQSITRRIKSLQEYVGQPDSDHPKSLFEIVADLNKELLDLKLKFENMEKGE